MAGAGDRAGDRAARRCRAAAWLAASAWQAHRLDVRRVAAERVLATATLDAPGLARRLTALGVEAELSPGKQGGLAALKQAKLAARPSPRSRRRR